MLHFYISHKNEERLYFITQSTRYAELTPIVIRTETYSTVDNQTHCAFYDKNMTFLPMLVHTIMCIFRCGGKSDLTSDLPPHLKINLMVCTNTAKIFMLLSSNAQLFIYESLSAALTV